MREARLQPRARIASSTKDQPCSIRMRTGPSVDERTRRRVRIQPLGHAPTARVDGWRSVSRVGVRSRPGYPFIASTFWLCDRTGDFGPSVLAPAPPPVSGTPEPDGPGPYDGQSRRLPAPPPRAQVPSAPQSRRPLAGPGRFAVSRLEREVGARRPPESSSCSARSPGPPARRSRAGSHPGHRGCCSFPRAGRRTAAGISPVRRSGSRAPEAGGRPHRPRFDVRPPLYLRGLRARWGRTRSPASLRYPRTRWYSPCLPRVSSSPSRVSFSCRSVHSTSSRATRCRLPLSRRLATFARKFRRRTAVA